MIINITGDLFESPAELLCHQVNCKGVMGSGVALEAKNRFPKMYETYHSMCEKFGSKALGDVQFFVTDSGNIIANMFAQDNYGSVQRQTQYDKFRDCLSKVYDYAKRYGLSVGFPYKVGCDRAGGDWKIVSQMIEGFFDAPDAPLCYIVALEQSVPVTSTSNSKSKVTIYADGACSGNPGPGGWGAILISGTNEKEISGAKANTTNNQMELQGVIEALRLLKKPCEIEVYSDSQYLCNAFNKHWIESWQKNNWRTASKTPVKNVDLWKELLSLMAPHSIQFYWVKGHASNPYNNRCDQLAVAARSKIYKEGV